MPSISKTTRNDSASVLLSGVSCFIFLTLRPFIAVLPERSGLPVFIALVALGLLCSVVALWLGVRGWRRRRAALALVGAVLAEAVLLLVVFYSLV